MREKLIDILENIGIYEVTMNAELIAEALIANGVTVREKGEWVHDPLSSYGVHVWFCSQCNGEVIRQTDYCPHCGADMRGEEHG